MPVERLRLASRDFTTLAAAKNVVLVHAAFADDSSWSKIVPTSVSAPSLHLRMNTTRPGYTTTVIIMSVRFGSPVGSSSRVSRTLLERFARFCRSGFESGLA
jgi:hypothetical protein